MLFSLLIASLLSTSVLAAPAARVEVGCDLSKAHLHLPSDKKALDGPPTAPSFISVAIGVQNYTCDAKTHKYTSVGAVAQMFDISCMYDKPEFHTVHDLLYQKWLKAPDNVTIDMVIKNMTGKPKVLGQHYFITNPDHKKGAPHTVPKWDFTSESHKGDAEAYMIGAKVKNLPSEHKSNVDWLSLKNTKGKLADTVYRVDTKEGQPPKSPCVKGSHLQVKYAAKYWFFGGSAKKTATAANAKPNDKSPSPSPSTSSSSSSTSTPTPTPIKH